MRKKITVVIPSYNEAPNIEPLIASLNASLAGVPHDFRILFVDDGSVDETPALLRAAAFRYPNVFYANLSRNFGHQNALKAGIDLATADADAVVSMDGDLQHPPELLPPMIAKWLEGYDVVYTVREEDPSLPFLKRKTSALFYRLMNLFCDIEFEPGTADFRLMDKKVALEFSRLGENELFIRGLVKWMGYRQHGIGYKPRARFSGDSKYTLSKMLRFAIQGVTSFSTRPLSLAIYLGMGLTLLASIIFVAHVANSLYHGNVISGWASLICTIVFFGGLNLTVLGIIGIYIGKLFMQSKGRPNYLMSETNYHRG